MNNARRYPRDFNSDGSLAMRSPEATVDKDEPFNTFLHYSNATARKERTVFGRKRDDLFYNYDDRLRGDKWRKGLELAADQATPKTARFYEIALAHFHGVDDVDLQHVVLGCNMSNGFSYLIFGYIYDWQKEAAAAAERSETDGD